MSDNITRQDADEVIKFLSQNPLPQLTNGAKVREFEDQWSKWLGVKHSLFVNSGSSANELTMQAIKYLHGECKVIVPPLTWVSDIASVIHAGLKPVFCDINLKNLSFDMNHLRTLVDNQTKVIFVTHVLGINALTQELLDFCREKEILLIEDVCESHGTTFMNKKVGSYGYASNFSYYFAHHMSTIEGGMVCTNDSHFYQVLRCLRSHGMLREATDENFKKKILEDNPDLNSDFVFIAASHNFRSTELNAVLGINQLKQLDANNKIRSANFQYFIDRLDPIKYKVDFEMNGQCNYAFIAILQDGKMRFRDTVEADLKKNGIEFRRGLSGGGSQIKQPYVKNQMVVNETYFPNIEHVHHYSWYIGNYPSLEKKKIDKLVSVLNNVKMGY